MTPIHRVALLLLATAGCQNGGGGPTQPQPVPPAPQDGFAFTYTAPAGAAVTSVSVAGSFNGWSTTGAPMTHQADGSWLARIRLADARYEYKFYINGAWPADMCDHAAWGDPAHEYWIDPDALGCVPDGVGGQNALIGVGTAADPGLGFEHDPASPALVSAAGGRVSIRFRANQRQVLAATLRAGGQAYPMAPQLTWRLQETWRGSVPEGTAQYTISVQTAAGTQEMGPFTVPGQLFRAVPWVGGSVGYQIFPERFWNGDPSNDALAVSTDAYPFTHPDFRGPAPLLTPQWNGPVTEQHCCHQYFGGDLQGVIQRLDYLRELGVTLVYLNPIFSSGSAHGYDTHDYLSVEPSFGDEAVLATLRDEAHARGIRLMWDFVPNHVGVGHAAFRDAVEKGTASPYWSWFTFKVPAAQVQPGNAAHYNAWWGFGSLPELNTRNPDVMDHLMGVVRKWTGFGLDGIRVDVPGEIDNRTEFFRAFRQTAKGIDPDTYLVGEIWERSPGWLQGDQFDALMNYAIGQDVIERYVTGAITAGAAVQAMAQLYGEYPEASAAMQFNVIATHDTGRLLSKLGGGALGATPGAEALARQRLAAAALYALPGVPVTFQGDECAQLGAGGGRDEHRYPVQWQACDAAMQAHYRALGQLKHDLPALASPVIRLGGGTPGVLSFLRGEPGTGEVLVLLNGGATARTLALPAGTWTDAVTGAAATGSVEVGAVGWRYLRRI
jgi:glycosidase